MNYGQSRRPRTHSALASTARWKTKTTKLALILIATGLLAAFLFSDGRHLLSLNELQRRHGQLQDLYRLRPAAVVAAFLAIEICALAVCLPGAVFTTALAGGAIFGPYMGTLVVLTGLTIGDSIGFLFARYLFKDSVEAKLQRQTNFIQRGVASDGAFYLLALRMTAVMPYFIVNLTMGLTSLPLRIFAPVSFLGLIPSTLLYVQAGTKLAQVCGPMDVMSIPLLSTLAALGIFPLLARKALRAGRRSTAISSSPSDSSG